MQTKMETIILFDGKTLWVGEWCSKDSMPGMAWSAENGVISF